MLASALNGLGLIGLVCLASFAVSFSATYGYALAMHAIGHL
jgi:hypothetical protein